MTKVLSYKLIKFIDVKVCAMFDLVIKNGCIIDGTGSPGFYSDIAIKNGKIEKIAKNIDGGKNTIDAKGLTVTPGFIDSHSHSDSAMLPFPDMIEKIEQGITTSIGGQCGSSPAPIYKGITDENAKGIAGFGKENEVYKTFGTMINIAKDIPFGSNLMTFVGHGALRKAVMGMDNRKPTPDEMQKMKELLKDAMENGAIGLSFGLIYTPSCYAETDELIELARGVKEYGGMLSAHIRDEGFKLIEAIDEFLKVIKETGLRAVFSHHKSTHRKNWGKVSHSLRMLEEANKDGYDVYCDVYPYTASHTSLSATIIAREMRATDDNGIVHMLQSAENREIIKKKYADTKGEDLSCLQITLCRNHPEYEGMRINEIADLRGQSHFDTAFDLICESENKVNICNFSMCEEDVETVLKYERAMICTDAGVAGLNKVYHPRLRGTFPRVLGRYVREKKITTLREMIRKITSMPASVYGLKGKGLIKEGFDADICIFDAEKIIDRAEYTACHKRCEGLNYVILGGEVVVEDAIYNRKRMGRFIPREK